MDFFRSKVFLALLGLVLIGGTVGGTVYVTSLPHTPMRSNSQAVLTTGTSSTSTIGKPSPTHTSTSVSPTDTPTMIIPTNTITPTNTPSATTLRGTVSSVGTSSFLLQGNSTSIVVTSQTAFTGSVQSFSTLQRGDFARVKGMYQTDGTFLAASVDAQPNNDN